MDQSELANDSALLLLSGEFADLVSIQQDLVFVAAAARRYALLGDEDRDGVLHRALWGSAVVMYRRCFTSGKGHGLVKRTRLVVPQTAIDSLDQDVKEAHEKALEAADKHVAHRVSDLSQMPVSLLFQNDPTSGSTKLAGLTVLGGLYLGPLPEEAKLLAKLADQLLATIETMSQAKQKEILGRASVLLEN